MKPINPKEYSKAFDLMMAGLTTQMIASEIMARRYGDKENCLGHIDLLRVELNKRIKALYNEVNLRD